MLRRSKSIALTMNSAFFAAMLITVILLNIYPSAYSRRILFDSVEISAEMFADEISADISDFSDFSRLSVAMRGVSGRRVIVTDASGIILFDSLPAPCGECGTVLLTKSVASALGGQEYAHSSLRGDTLTSELVRPIGTPGDAIGALVVLSYDFELPLKLNELDTKIFFLSLLISALPLLISVVISRNYSGKISKISRGLMQIQNRKYGESIDMHCADEFGALADGIDLTSKKLKEYDDNTRRFVSDASHELKTPLASIKLLSDSILQTPNMDHDSINEFLNDINQEIDRLTRISSRLLQLTRLDGTASDVHRERLDISAVAATVCRMLDPLARSANCTIRTEFTPNCFVEANYDHIYQIFYNLIENSIKYSGTDKEVRVFIFARDEQAVFIVDDDGDGIPESDLNKIFERFYRVDKARARATGGTGLGLSIVASAVAMSGGTVSASNRAGGGARFTVKFPYCQ